MLLPKGYKTPLNPQTWLNAQAINTTTCGGYSELNIAQMANGNILSTWTTGDPTDPGSPDEVDIPGQWFNPMGAKIGTEFVVNRASTTDHEGNGDIVALPGGGRIIV